ncbi:hypothetical protein LSH36_806g01018, partial [Paralvinella palmiformis]
VVLSPRGTAARHTTQTRLTHTTAHWEETSRIRDSRCLIKLVC